MNSFICCGFDQICRLVSDFIEEKKIEDLVQFTPMSKCLQSVIHKASDEVELQSVEGGIDEAQRISATRHLNVLQIIRYNITRQENSKRNNSVNVGLKLQ